MQATQAAPAESDDPIDFDAFFAELFEVAKPARSPRAHGLHIVAREVVRAGVGMEAPFVVEFGLQPGTDAPQGGADPTLHSLAEAEHWMICEAVAWMSGKGIDNLAGILSVSLTTLCEARFPGEVASAAAAGGVRPARLCFEIPADTAAKADDATIGALHALRDAGFGFAFCDFAADETGLQALKRLPARYLRVSLAALEDGAAQHAALRTTQRLARGLGIAAIADGITDAHRFRRVQDSGMAYASGDHLSPAAALESL